MSTEHNIAETVRDYWHVITGCSVALFWMGVHVKRRIQDPYARVSMMENCRNSIISRLDAHEKVEMAKYEKIMESHSDSLERVYDKIDDLRINFDSDLRFLEQF